MRILIVGLGSIGLRHLANLRVIEPAAHVTICDPRLKAQDAAEASSLADCIVYRLEDAFDAKPEAALITCPASLHIETGLALARQGVHLFIEKPLSNTLNGVDELSNFCRQHSLILMVGYNFRFYQPLLSVRQALREGKIGRVLAVRAEVGQFLPDWRPGRDYRQTVSARDHLGGGAVLELSHEIDYVRWLVGEVKTVSAQVARVSDLEIDVEDTAEIILQFHNGAIGSIHLDMIQQPATRTCRIVGTKGTIEWDGFTNSVRVIEARERGWSYLHPPGNLSHQDMYLAEMSHFLECVRGNGPPLVNGGDGKRVLEIALAVKESSVTHRVIEL